MEPKMKNEMGVEDLQLSNPDSSLGNSKNPEQIGSRGPNEVGIEDLPVGNPALYSGSASGSGDSNNPELIGSGAPIVGDQVSGARTGKTCHQCRQKLIKPSVNCKNIRRNKQCVMKFCCRCLLNRYGEKEVTMLDDWKCPKCRGICNCSACMRGRSQAPTGRIIGLGQGIMNQLVLAPKQSSTSEQLPVQEEVNEVVQVCDAALEPMDVQVYDAALEPMVVQLCDAALEPMAIDDLDTLPAEEANSVEITLPLGKELTSMGEDINFPAQDAGNVLQFIEFCGAFEEILGITKEQVDEILFNMMAERSKFGEKPLIQLQIRLLKLIMCLESEEYRLSLQDGENCWLRMLEECISESKGVPKELAHLDFETYEHYYMLGSSIKLGILVFLCDKSLDTVLLRTWIEGKQEQFSKEKIEAKSRRAAAKERKNQLKEQMKVEANKDTSAEGSSSLSLYELDVAVPGLKAESERMDAEIIEIEELLNKYEQKSAAFKTWPVFDDNKGHIIWSLKAREKQDFLLQEISGWNQDKLMEKWFSFDDEELEAINKQIPVHRVKKTRKRRKSSAPSATMESAPTTTITPAPEQSLQPAAEDIAMNPVSEQDV